MPISTPDSPRGEMPRPQCPGILQGMEGIEVAEVRSSARCPVCGGRLEATLDPAAADPWVCPDPTCPVTDDASAWMGGGE